MNRRVFFAAMIAGSMMGAAPQARAQSLPLLDPTTLANFQATMPLVPLLTNPALTLSLLSPQTLQTTLVSVSTLPGVSSPLPFGAILNGVLRNFR